MRPEDINLEDLIDRTIGPLTLLFGFENGKYSYGNSLMVRGDNQSVIMDPCLGVVARKDAPPTVGFVLHSHAHEDHIAGTHLFDNTPWWVHSADAIGLSGIDGLMEIYGLSSRPFGRRSGRRS